MQFVARERAPQFLEQTQPMKRQRLLKTLIQTAHRRSVQQAQLRSNPRHRRIGFGVGGLIVSALELLPERGLFAGWQIAHHVLAFVPLAALHGGLVAEDLVDRLAQTLGAVDHAQ